MMLRTTPTCGSSVNDVVGLPGAAGGRQTFQINLAGPDLETSWPTTPTG